MRHRTLGATDLRVSEVGVPVWDLLSRPDDEAAALLRAALDLGVSFFDATDSDQDGRAERLLGEAVRGHRDEVTVATTFGYDTSRRLFEQAGTGPRHDWSPSFAGRALDRSLGRLRLEPVDLWQLHHPGMDALAADELFAFLDEQVAKGKVRCYGVVLGLGRAGGDEGEVALRERGVAAVQAVFNVAEQAPGRELARTAAETGAALVARDPLAPRLPADARARLDFLARDRGRTLDQALLRFALADPAVASVLPPVADAVRLAELAGAADVAELDGEELDRVAELHEARFGAAGPASAQGAPR
ncbi:MAG TPA: aldo/keto reductase [Actinomycetes bacterium]|nr:aldo/keto reductase [Actinomycetes bacterium]